MGKRPRFAKVLKVCSVSDTFSQSGDRLKLFNSINIFVFDMSSEPTSLPPKLSKIVDRFQRRSNPKQKYEQLLWYAKKLPAMPESGKTEENKSQRVCFPGIHHRCLGRWKSLLSR